ncbi:MAG: hypothetical protein MUC87_09050 [Bacteroidia bacterium]|jgi:hypothetical protein|nr:hypothetical protein [Bacteroidia bacterium]
MSSTGSIEAIAIEFSKLLRPLREDLGSAAGTKVFFGRIGVVLSNTQAGNVAASGAISTAVTNTEALITLSGEIIAAITAENYTLAAEKSVAAIEKIATLIEALTTIGNNIHSIHATIPPSQVAERMFSYLLFRYLDNAKGINEVLELLGLLDRNIVNENSTNPDNPEYETYTYRFDRIGTWFSNPAQAVKDIYDWGKNDFDGSKLFGRIEGIVSRFGLPVLYDDTSTPKRLDLVFFEAVPKTDVSPPGLLVRLKNKLSTGEITIPMGDMVSLIFKIDFEPPYNTGFFATPNGGMGFQPPTPGSSISGDFNFKLRVRKNNPPEPILLFGESGGSRLELGELLFSTGTKVTWNGTSANGTYMFELAATGLKVVIDTSKGDGFLNKIMAGVRAQAEFDLVMGISSERGFYFGGSSALEIKLPTHIALGPISLEGLTIAAKLQGGKIPISAGADVRAELGPMVAVVQNIGIIATLSFPPNNSGNLGPLQLDVGFKPPNGVGLSINTGAVKGGGFLYFDWEKGEYFGGLELSFQNMITLKAIAIINTKMPDGKPGFALLILVTAEFTPIQLGFGFTLNGVGGLLALNRTLDIQALKNGVRTGAVSSILFPKDVVANINKIISDLKTIFPIAEGHFIIAPMGKFGWGTPTLISLEVGIILDIPQPQFSIIGVLRCILPTEEAAILKLQVNFAGGIDFDKGELWFDASLFDSSLLIFSLSGDMALRIGWGDNPMFIISVGGFHPAFKEVPPELAGMKRLMISLLSGDNPRLNAQIYFAVTSNTVQSGAKVELYAGACGFSIEGWLGYDLLVQFSPFHFIASIYAGLALKCGGSTLCGVRVQCTLSGPTPWHADGEASITILFFDITVGFDVTWGENAPSQPAETEDVLALTRKALEDDRNWRAVFPANTNLSVTLKKVELPEDKIIVHPFGNLEVSQKVVPLGVEINKFGNKKPTGDTKFELTHSAPASEIREEFAMANFLTLNDSDKLSRKSFERMRSGLGFGTGNSIQHGAETDKEVNYELSYVHRKKNLVVFGGLVKLIAGMHKQLSKGNAAHKSPYAVSKKKPGTPPADVLINEPGYHVVNVSDLNLFAPGMVAKTQTEAVMMMNELIAEKPALKGKIQIAASHELN